MKEIIQILKNSLVIYLATVDENGQANNRPFALALETRGKLYFSTSSETSTYLDLQNNPYVAITIMTPEHIWIRLKAKAVFSEDLEIKEKILQEKEFLKSTFEQAKNPKFKVFYLMNGVVTRHDYSGQPPREYSF